MVSILIERWNQPPVDFIHRLRSQTRKDKPGFDLTSDALPSGVLCYGELNAASNAVDYTKFYSRSHRAVICVCDSGGNGIESHEQTKSPNDRARIRLQAESWQITGIQKKVTQATGN